MTLAEKTKKLLEYSVIIRGNDKKLWLDTLPRMGEKQVQTLYGVLVDEVRAWKKEGISIVPDPALELKLMPTPEHGSSLDTLKARLEGKTSPGANKPAPNPSFSQELKKEMAMPELPAPAAEQAKPEEAEEPEEEIIFGQEKLKQANPDKNAWMISNDVVVPKVNQSAISHKPVSIPKIRNRVAKHGLEKLGDIRSIDDLGKIEAAHLRQGPLREQLLVIKQKISQLARDNDMLPINIIPVFEQSHLFKTYLKAGSMMIENNSAGTKIPLDQVMAEMENMGQETLSQAEFEAVADLKKEIEAMAGI